MAAAHSDPRIRKIVESLRAYDPERVIVFGSVARGQADAFSDLDIVVIKETDERFVRRLLTAGDYLPLDCGSIDVLVYTPGEFERMHQTGNPFIAEVVADGVTVYERSRSVTEEPVEYRAGTEPVVKGRRWLRQAEYDLAAVRDLVKGLHFAMACFGAQQAAEKALKAFLYWSGEQRVIGHSIKELCDRCAGRHPAFTALCAEAIQLDRFYVAARYPDALPDDLPSEAHGEPEAQLALELANRVLEFVRSLMPPITEAE